MKHVNEYNMRSQNCIIPFTRILVKSDLPAVFLNNITANELITSNTILFHVFMFMMDSVSFGK